MSKFFALANEPHTRHCAAASFGKWRKYNTLNFILGSLTIGLVMLGIANTAGITEKGYQLKLLEEQKSTLAKEQETLLGQVSSAQSMGEVGKRLGSLSLEKITSIEYLSPSGGAVAIRD